MRHWNDKVPVPLASDGFKRITSPELLARHRNATISRGDLVRAIATLEEKVDALTARLANHSIEG